APQSTGTYWYGVTAVDNKGNEGKLENSVDEGEKSGEVYATPTAPNQPLIHPSYFSEEWIEKTIKWAEDQENSNNWYDEKTKMGYCMAFVSDSFKVCDKKDRPSSPNNLLERIGGKDKLSKGENPPRGSLVFFSAKEPYEEYGHIGISLGDKKVVHAFGNVTIESIDQIKEKGFIDSYLGWTYPPKEWYPSKFSNTFETGNSISKKDGWNLRDIPSLHGKILFELKGAGKIIEDENNGACNSGHYWWHVKLENHEGWCAEEGLEKSEASPPATQTGTLTVTITGINNAKFTITGPKTYEGSGTFWTTLNAPVGTYTITYGTVNGYIAPLPETKTLAPNGKITFNGEYTKEIVEVEQSVADLPTFFTGVLKELDIAPNGFALNALQIWATKYENTKAQYNPLATTWTTGKPGETKFNNAGVKNYPDIETGIEATVKTLKLSHYTAVREMLALKSFDEGNLKKAVAIWSDLNENEQYVQNLVNEWKETDDTYHELNNRINQQLKILGTYAYPKWRWILFKQKEYDELHQAGIDYDLLSYNAIIKSSRFLRNGDIINAQEYLTRSLNFNYISSEYFCAAAYFADGYYEKAEEKVRLTYELSKMTAKVIASAIPGASKIIDAVFLTMDYAIDCSNNGLDEATKNLATDIAIDMVLNKIPFNELGGKTLKDALENQVGGITFPLIQKMISENKQIIVSKMVKEFSLAGVVELSKCAGELSNQIVDGISKRLIEQQEQIKLNSPGELRVFDSEGRVTGLVNGCVKNEIQRSSYDNETVTIFFPTDSYRYEIVGTDNDTYGLMVTSVDGENISTFTFVDVQISTNATHQYLPEWGNSTGTASAITVKMDSDGDGIFESERTIDLYSSEESANAASPRSQYFGLPVIIGVIIALLCIGGFGAGFYIHKRKQKVVANDEVVNEDVVSDEVASNEVANDENLEEPVLIEGVGDEKAVDD
ncbi:MAG: hypothetical protein CVT48_04550, partial [Thermoplasmata archaeon HGW-Thermoplasmata-1]